MFTFYILLKFLSSSEDMFTDIYKKRKTERERERETDRWTLM